MKPSLLKPAVVMALLAFVVISLAYAVMQEVRRAPVAVAAEQPKRAVPPSGAGLDALKGGKGKAAAPAFYATYYHGNTRCPTCIKIEEYSKECVETRFAKEIKAGKLAYRVINYEEKGNEHFWGDYKLTAQSLILSKVQDGKELRWKNLEKVWDLTYDKGKFFQYVEDELRAFMKGQDPSPAEAGPTAGAAPPLAAAGGRAAPSASAAPAEHKVVAYYLHGDTRCPSCIKIEQWADAAVHERFARELADGKLEWQVVNYDEPRNRHYLGDFQLEFKVVVLADYVNGKQVRYKRLDAVWDLLDDQQAFTDYIADEVRQYLEGA